MRVVRPRGRLDGRVTGGSDRNALSWVALAVVVTCIDPALVATSKTFSDPLSTVIGMVSSRRRAARRDPFGGRGAGGRQERRCTLFEGWSWGLCERTAYLAKTGHGRWHRGLL